MQTLRRGAEGFEVALWQGFLIEQGLLEAGNAIGTFGPKTEQATRTFQAGHGLMVDGLVGPQTLAAAKKLHFIIPHDLTELAMDLLPPDAIEQLTQVHPLLAERIMAVVIEVRQGTSAIRTLVDSAHRDFAEQDTLFAQGRDVAGPVVTNVPGGQSYHNYGLAVDLTSLIAGEEVWSDEDATVRGSVGKRLGLEWGGDWAAFRALSHLQLTVGLTTQDCFVRYQRSGIEGVWQDVSSRLAGGGVFPTGEQVE